MGSPSIVPAGSLEQDSYLVLEDFGDRGRAWRETDETDTSREVLIRQLMEGQYSAPVKIIAFNTGAGWVKDVTKEIKAELRERCRSEDMPPELETFLA